MANETVVSATNKKAQDAAAKDAAENNVSTIVETKVNSIVFSTKHSGDDETGFDYLVATLKTDKPISAVFAAEDGNKLEDHNRFSVRANKLFAQISSLKEEEITALRFAIWRKEKSFLADMSAEEVALSGLQPDTHVDLPTWEKILVGSTIKVELKNDTNEDGELYTVKDIVSIEFGFLAKSIIDLAKSKFEENLQLYMGL